MSFTPNLKNDLLQAQKRIQEQPTIFYDYALDCPHWSKQDEITNSVFRNQRTTVPSCHGAGKSFIAARIGLAFLMAYEDSIVITTAPTFRQVENVIWREMRGAIATAKIDLGGKILKTRYELGENWYALGISSDKQENLQGFHAKSGHILIIVDETAGVGAPSLNAIEGMLTSRDVHLLYIGNPIVGMGPFFESAKSPYFNKISISVFDTPNFKFNKIRKVSDLKKFGSLEELEGLPLVYPALVTPSWAWLRLQDWGEDSPMFQAKVLAQFPEEGEDTLINLHLVEQALAKEWSEEEMRFWPRKNVLGIDVARFGSDSTSMIAMNNHKMLDLRKFSGKDLMQTCGLAIQLFQDMGFVKSMDLIAIDDTGLGGGVTDRLKELGYNVFPINFGSASEEEGYVNLKAEVYWHLRELFRTNSLSILDKGKLVSQLPTTRYNYTSNARLEIVSKQKMKKEGLDSPDDSDALAIACWALRSGLQRMPDNPKGGTVAGNLYRKKF